MDKNKINIFCDGACSGNPGPGAWAFLLYDMSHDLVVEKGGFETLTTNNRMELRAAISALDFMLQKNLGGEIQIYTDSKLLIQGITQWVFGWGKRNWIKSDGSPVLNTDLWKEILKLSQKFHGSLNWIYVPGHSHILGNNRVDEIAVAFSKRQELSLYEGPIRNYPHKDIFEQQWDQESPSQKNQNSTPWYLSLIQGEILRHKSWSECEARVKGQPGAKYKKFKTEQEEREWLKIHLPRKKT